MQSFVINLFLLEFFSLLVVLTVKGKKGIINSLIIFHGINGVKLVFLCLWAIHKTGGIDFDYLHFSDEHYYLSPWHVGDRIPNLYRVIVYAMQTIGFSISNIKMVNILVSSFAIVRLYTLKDLVADRRRYVLYLFTLAGVFFLHIIYHSIFVHKDALFFYISVEFFIQLIRRPVCNRSWLIALLATVLMLIRPPMVLGFAVFLFNRNWRICWARVLLVSVVAVTLIVPYRQACKRFLNGCIAVAARENLEMGRVDPMAGRRNLVNPLGDRRYHSLVVTNIQKATSILFQTDVTYRLILVIEWAVAVYLLIIKRYLSRLVKFWPVMAAPLLYFIGGSLTLYNIRYNLFPATFLLCLSIYVASRPLTPMWSSRR
jgi:hypothetical protein